MREFLAAAVALLFSFSAHADWSVAGMNRQIDQTNFVVNEGCSGTLIDIENRYILTAAHCIGGQYETVEIEKVSPEGKVTTEKVRRLKPGIVSQMVFDGVVIVSQAVFRTKVIAVDKSRDLALVQAVIKIPNTLQATLACVDPVRGDPVTVVGNPMGVLNSSVVKGIVSSIQRSYEMLRFGDAGSYQQPLMQISAGVIGGNSGGSVYNENGLLIGVPVLAHAANEILGFAVPLNSIKEFLKNNKLESLYAHCAT